MNSLDWNIDRVWDYARQLEVRLARLQEVLAELKTSRCPGGGYTGQPEDEEPTVENCLRAANCGCTAGEAVRKATDD